MLAPYRRPTLSLSLPPSTDGTRETLKIMRLLQREGRTDDYVRQFAAQIIGHVEPKDWAGELAALFFFVQNYIRYQRDVVDRESLSIAAQILAQGFGDCDDKSVALAALAGSIGIPTAFAALAFTRGGPFTHVIAFAWLDGPGWVALDATEPHAPGWSPPDARRIMFISNQD